MSKVRVVKGDFWVMETRIRWWHCWRWMFAEMAVLRIGYGDTGYLMPRKTADAICEAIKDEQDRIIRTLEAQP